MIFLSHSTVDKPWIRFVGGELQAAGLKFWLDEKQLLPGDALRSTIELAIEQAAFMVAFLSRKSIHSPWVQFEIEAVRRLSSEARGRFVPCLIGDIDFGEVPPDIAAVLCVDFRDPSAYSAQMGRLLRKLSLTGLSGRLPPFTAHRSADLARRASVDGMVRKWAVGWLCTFVSETADETERYWAYLTLGKLGDPSLCAFLADAAARELRLARRGAEQALQSVRHEDGPVEGELNNRNASPGSIT